MNIGFQYNAQDISARVNSKYLRYSLLCKIGNSVLLVYILRIALRLGVCCGMQFSKAFSREYL